MKSWILFSIAVALLTSERCWAIDPFEIHVHSDEMAAPGRVNLELGVNNFLSARREPEYEEEVIPDGATHISTEVSLGLTKFWEVGGAVQAGLDSAGAGHLGGFKLRSKVEIPKQESDLVSYGINLEVGRFSLRFSEEEWITELRPIICLESSQWHWHLNPVFAWGLSGKNGLTPDLEFATKIGYQIDQGFSAGIEHFVEFGAMNSIPSISEQEHITFLTSDIETDFLNISFGIGHGLTEVSPQWITKLNLSKTL